MSMITLLQADPKLRTDPQYASQLLDKLLLAFGGSPFFFSNEEKVAFLLDLTLPTDSEQGVNFDIRLAYALVTLVRKHKAGAVEFFYQPAPGFTGEQILEKSGYQALAELNDVRLTDLTGCPTVSRRSMTGLTGDQVEIYAPLAQADVVISLAKYKAAQGKLFGSALRSLMICTPTQYEEEFQDRAPG